MVAKFKPGDKIVLKSNPTVQLRVLSVQSHEYVLTLLFYNDPNFYEHTMEIWLIDDSFRLMSKADKVLYGNR